MGRILIQNGRVWGGNQFLRADVLVENGKIVYRS